MSANTTLVLIFSLCILAPSGVIGAAVYASINALGRNPSAAPKIFTAMTMTMVFAEALAIIGLLITFQVFAP
jgi:F0F1-type ATP synthase membrane subunit c/vacuolar-type H+-ATPase subunit K